MSLTPQQIDRGLALAESVITLAAEVWRSRKLARRLAPGVAATDRPRSRGIKVANANRKARSRAKKPGTAPTPSA
jgi:hypothetical protein